MQDLKAEPVTDNIAELKARILKLQQRSSNQQLAHHLMERLEGLQAVLDASMEPVPTEEVSTSSVLQSTLEVITQNLQEIKQLLSLKATASIGYEAIQEDWVRVRLLADNLRMENGALDVSLSNGDRFFDFCTNAFYQIEDLLNYHFWKRFPNFSDCVDHFVTNGTKFERKPKWLPDIQSHSKIAIFEREFYYVENSYYDSKLTLIRKIRNSNQHRCTIILDTREQLYSDYMELIDRMDRFKRDPKSIELKLTYQKSSVDLKVEENGKLAVLMKEHPYEEVRSELKTLYKKVLQHTPITQVINVPANQNK